MDLGTFQQPRKLPILKDLLERAYAHSDADWVIYTNVDIALMPYFYTAVRRHLEQGHDALIINRRTIPDTWSNPVDLPLMFAEAGESHLGYDCFVFPREWIRELDVGEVCIGVHPVGLTLTLALASLAESLRLLEHAHLTFHIGNDLRWKNPAFDDLTAYNQRECKAAIDRLEQAHGAFDADLPSWSWYAVQRLKGLATQPKGMPAPLPGRLLGRLRCVARCLVKG